NLDYTDPVLEALNGLARVTECYLLRGQELAAAGKIKEAEESRQRAMLLLESLPIQLAGKPDLLADVYSSVTMALMKAGQAQQAKELCCKLLEQMPPRAAGLCNDVAWFLATAEVPAHREPALAVELAEKAVQSNPQSGDYR